MEFNREAKSLIAIMALVAAMACGMNAVVTNEPDQSLLGWSVGLFVVAVLFWIWIRRDDLAEKRGDALKAADEAARQAEELAKKAQDKAAAKVEILAEDVHDYTDEMEEALEEAEEAEPVAEATDDDKPEPIIAETVVVEDDAGEEKVVIETVPLEDAVAAADEPDDLSKVEGIGPVYQTILKDAGVATFAAIAAKSTEELETIIKDAGKRRPASIETWAEQAALAAKGDWAGLEKLQNELDGGRRK